MNPPSPSLSYQYSCLVADGATRVVVLPYFLYPGRHIQRDIPALVDGARAANPAVTIEVGQLFGADPAVLDLLATQLSLAAGPDAAEDR